jgi:hypothetical protein
MLVAGILKHIVQRLLPGSLKCINFSCCVYFSKISSKGLWPQRLEKWFVKHGDSPHSSTERVLWLCPPNPHRLNWPRLVLEHIRAFLCWQDDTLALLFGSHLRGPMMLLIIMSNIEILPMTWYTPQHALKPEIWNTLLSDACLHIHQRASQSPSVLLLLWRPCLEPLWCKV